ncbi:MAG TPA: cyclase family protein [Candidatus Acidoferrales bacterium]|nr:cyclase family protein [Candidatus Acidoferrales bacterium]
MLTALEGINLGRTRVIDLTHTINDHLPPWPGDKKSFEAQPNATIEREGYFTRSFWMLEHYGTHLDAPAHFPPGKTTVDQIPVERLVGPAVVLDVREESRSKPAGGRDYRLPVARVQQWEQLHGPVPERAIVLLRTGCAEHWPHADRYRNLDSAGSMHFPGFSVEAVKYLLSKRISGIGADAMSVDPGDSRNYEVHHFALGSDLFQLENLANLDSLPESGAWLIVAPIKLEGGSGGPCRVFAIVPA